MLSAATIIQKARKELDPTPPVRGSSAALEIQDVVSRLHRALTAMAQAAKLDTCAERLATRNTLRSALPAAARLISGDPAEAALVLYRVWRAQAAEFSKVRPAPESRSSITPVKAEELERLEPSYEIACIAEIEEELCTDRESHGRATLARLKLHLDLSLDELGRCLGVTGETVRRWERGLSPIPPERLAAIASQGSALNRLGEFLRTEWMPVATRRKAAIFGGESAHDLILRGQISKVVDQYERALRYQA